MNSNLKSIEPATWHRNSAMTRTILLMFLTVVRVTNATVSCNPDDPDSCRFGGVCVPVLEINVELRGYDVDHYCRCPEVRCSAVQDINTICGDNGVTYVNEVCLRLEECANQMPIKPVCKGFCRTEECTPSEIDASAFFERCRPEDDFCSGNGLCLRYPVPANPRFCKCYKGYDGTRCNLKISEIIEEMDECDGSAKFKWPFFFCIGLLAVIIILQIIYCVFRIRSTDTQNNFDECCKTQKEKSESTAEKIEEQIGEVVDQVNQVNENNKI